LYIHAGVEIACRSGPDTSIDRRAHQPLSGRSTYTTKTIDVFRTNQPDVPPTAAGSVKFVFRIQDFPLACG
jgi:hypothetical protein